MIKIVGEIRPYWIFHLAAVSNVRSSWQMRNETIETNVLGIYNLLEAVRQTTPAARVLFISSSQVYGFAASPTKALREDAPLQITNPCAYSKDDGEMLCGFCEKVENLDIVIARPFPNTAQARLRTFSALTGPARLPKSKQVILHPS